METLVILINIIWLWACLVPALLVIAIFLIRVGLRLALNRQPQGHQHNWVYDSKGSTAEIPPVEPNPKHVGNDPKSWPDNWFGIFHDRYTCECGEEKTETRRDLY
jgi:hypothetical protein